MMRDYDGKQFQSITTADLDLDSEEEKKDREEKTEANKDMLSAMKDALGEAVKEVRISSRLKDDPVCVVAAEGPSLDMERYMANEQNAMFGKIKANKILEINPDHAIFGKLQEIYRDHPEQIGDYADVLFQQALLIQGLPIEDPVAYTKKITELMIRSN
jgi:molecular chaperone HtpG